ncbi:hypothetical protein MG293_009989 [Ovis ammon polii]|uniref:Carboxypeptidase Q n=1 Tax=Ovis ammon polii TaxID=230172 RepID=A0AAD4U7T4_OVIAM|nr:hypothetical protein MG293_009989 [Ovis ammon polii]
MVEDRSDNVLLACLEKTLSLVKKEGPAFSHPNALCQWVHIRRRLYWSVDIWTAGMSGRVPWMMVVEPLYHGKPSRLLKILSSHSSHSAENTAASLLSVGGLNSLLSGRLKVPTTMIDGDGNDDKNKVGISYSLCLFDWLRPKRTLRLVLWTAEEQGGIGSSQYYQLHKANSSNYSLVMESDLGTFLPSGLKFTGSDSARIIMEEVMSLLKPINITQVLKAGDGTDINFWIQDGVPVKEIPSGKQETGSARGRKIRAQKQFKRERQIAQKSGRGRRGCIGKGESVKEGAEGKTGDRKRNDVDLRNGLNKGVEKVKAKCTLSETVFTDVFLGASFSGASLLDDLYKYFSFHHSHGDTMTVMDPKQMNVAAAVWAVVSYVVADLEEMLPRS